MQLGKSLLGAIIGGVLGIATLVMIHSLTGWDKAWLAIPVAIFTGVGVRWMVATAGHPSYARGGLTAVLAILAFMVGNYVVAEVATRRAASQQTALAPAERQQADDAGEGAGGAGDEAPLIEPVRLEERSPLGGTGVRNPRAQQWSTWDFLWLCVAAFIAYELGRGTNAASAPRGTDVRDEEEPPPATGQTPMPPD